MACNNTIAGFTDPVATDILSITKDDPEGLSDTNKGYSAMTCFEMRDIEAGFPVEGDHGIHIVWYSDGLGNLDSIAPSHFSYVIAKDNAGNFVEDSSRPWESWTLV